MVERMDFTALRQGMVLAGWRLGSTFTEVLLNFLFLSGCLPENARGSHRDLRVGKTEGGVATEGLSRTNRMEGRAGQRMERAGGSYFYIRDCCIRPLASRVLNLLPRRRSGLGQAEGEV